MREDKIINKPLDIPFKEFMPGQIIQSVQFNDDMKDIEDKVNEIVDKHNLGINKLHDHLEDLNNPHNVTPHQVGTYTNEEIDEFVDDIKNGNLFDKSISNRVLDDECVDTRVIQDGSVTVSKVDPELGSQLNLENNISITSRYTKEETDAIIQEKVGDGTYSKEQIDAKFEEYQAGTIVDGTIDVSKLKYDVGTKLDISANPSITDRYTKAEVNNLIQKNGLPKDWGGLGETQIDTPITNYGHLPIADVMTADEFIAPLTTVLDIDVKENVDARGEYSSLGDRLNKSDEKQEELSSQLEHNVNRLVTGKFPVKDKLKGASVYLPIPNGQPSFDEILEKLIYSNCNTISLCPTFWMDSSDANNISGFKNGMTLNDVKSYFIKAKEKGLNVILKPHVGGDGFTSWSSIKPSNVELWITNYSNFYKSMVEDLVEYIDVFCISNELKGQTNNFKNLWVNLINSLKAKKDIPVISALTISESTTNIFLDKLDYIGFNMYCPVEGDMSTDINQQTKSIFRLKPYINDMFNVMSKYNKKAIITEVGILPFEVSLQNPEMWGFDIEPPTNYQVQQRYYNIAVKEFLYANNVVGVMVWNACDGFTFINRPAQETLKEIYGGVK